MKPKGQVLIVVNILTSVLLIYSLALVNLAFTARSTEKKEDLKILTDNIAEAGIEKAIWCLNQTEGSNCGGTYGSSYIGENDIAFGEGMFDIAITDISPDVKEIEASAYYPNKANPLSQSTIKMRAGTDEDRASFNYGVQVGEGGLEMGSNTTINGSVYSNGSINGNDGALITGDAYVAQGTAISADQAHEIYNNDFIFGQSNPQVDIAQSFVPSTSDVLNKVSFYIKKVDSPSNITVRILEDDNGEPGFWTLASATLNSSLVSTNYSWIDVSFTNPPSLTQGETYWIVLDAQRKSSKYWIIGTDGFDGYSEGELLYSDSWLWNPWYSTGYDINFKTWMGGVITEIKDTNVGGNAYAYRIDNSEITGNAEAYEIINSNITGSAFSNSIIGTTIGQNASSTSISNSSVGDDLWCESYDSTSVGGANYCPTSITPPELPGPASMPISEAIINDWRTDAENGGIIEGDFGIYENQDLGPVKINGDLTIYSNVDLNITGTVYVTGDINFVNNVNVALNPSYGTSSGIILADGNIIIGNNVDFYGAGAGSYIILISTSPDGGFLNPAISLINNISASILFAPYGRIDLVNNIDLKQVNAYKLNILNNVQINYETGLSDISFTSGPSGGWSRLKGTWRITD